MWVCVSECVSVSTWKNIFTKRLSKNHTFVTKSAIRSKNGWKVCGIYRRLNVLMDLTYYWICWMYKWPCVESNFSRANDWISLTVLYLLCTERLCWNVLWQLMFAYLSISLSVSAIKTTCTRNSYDKITLFIRHRRCCCCCCYFSLLLLFL